MTAALDEPCSSLVLDSSFAAAALNISLEHQLRTANDEGGRCQHVYHQKNSITTHLFSDRRCFSTCFRALFFLLLLDLFLGKEVGAELFTSGNLNRLRLDFPLPSCPSLFFPRLAFHQKYNAAPSPRAKTNGVVALPAWSLGFRGFLLSSESKR